jgi:hypothetical protein
VVSPHDTSWIDRTIENLKARQSHPGTWIGLALERLLVAGADRKDIHEVVRLMQYELLFSLCYLLDDPGELEPELADLSWRLVRTTHEGETIGTINGLHESVLDTEPAGHEMRPQKR